MEREDSTEETAAEENEKKIVNCAVVLKTGNRKGKACGRKALYNDKKCGLHTSEHTKKAESGEHLSTGTSDLRKVDVVLFPTGTYVLNVVGSSKDKGKWKDFYIKHSGLEKYPATCRAKDCESVASCTGHMYLRDVASKKHNYLVPICSHHNSEKYDETHFLLKKTTVGVKILQNQIV